ncbi:MAG: hypothetical protein ACO3WU_05175 [Ilumatobacteraceae bacterium]
MITTGVTGSQWRASITPWGGLVPWEGPPLDWYVAADDRWHVPAHEPAVRQVRLDGTPVTETRVRVPHGDVVQRIYSVAEGCTIVEVENESTLPVAIAFDRRDVLTERPIASVPIEGIELPESSFVLPLGHRATLRIGIPHRASAGGRLPDGLPTARSVVRGWTLLTDRAGRFVLPEGGHGASLAERVVSERCEIALGSLPTAADDPAGFCVALGELVRMGEPPSQWLPELVDAVAAVGPEPGWRAGVALDAADRVLAAAGEQRARRDLSRIGSKRARSLPPPEPPDDRFVIPWIERSLVDGGALFPYGLPAGWAGAPVEAHGLPTVGRSTVSFAVRWHGARPAVLWEQAGDPVALTSPVLAPDWSSDEPRGETLWPVPPGATSFVVPSDDPVSFA